MARLGRSFLVAETVGALVAIVFAARLGSAVPSVVDALCFLAVMTLISMFDVWLPHGDSVDIAQPLAIGAAFAIGPVPAMGVAVASRLVAHIVRYRLERSEQLLHLLARRAISLGVAAMVAAWLASWRPIQSFAILVVVLAASAAVVADAVLLQAYTASRQRQSVGRLFAGSLRLQGLMWGAYASVAALTAILYPEMGVWGLLLMMGLLVVMRQSFSFLLDIRGAYQATMEALAAALEAHDSRRQGHASRVAALARAIGVEIGLHGKELERLSYAALLHDVDLIGTEESDESTPPSRASEVLQDVKFLADVLPILALCDGGANGSAADDSKDRLLAYVVCRASNMDELITHERAAVRVYPPDLMSSILSKEQREPIERAVWRLLTPGARLST